MRNKLSKINLKYVFIIIGLIVFAQGYHMFFSNYSLQSPIILQSPIKDRYLSPVNDGPSVIEINKKATPSAKPTSTTTPTPKPKKKTMKYENQIHL